MMRYTALVYSGRRIDAIPVYFNSEENAIEICAALLNSQPQGRFAGQTLARNMYYQILLYDPTGKLIATYKPEQIL